MDKNWHIGFKDKLDKVYVWPSLYIFKFIVPHDKVDEVKILFPLHISTEKQSAKGKYTSITFSMMMPSSNAVIEVYEKVKHIEGLIAI